MLNQKIIEGVVMQVLLVEDNPADQVLAVEAFKGADVQCALNVVDDGEQAIEYLRHEGKYGESSRPDLILLDLNMPKMSGREVLKIVKSDPDLAEIPVVVLTTSSNPSDVEACYQAHANSYICKPASMGEFSNTIKEVGNYWFGLVKLP